MRTGVNKISVILPTYNESENIMPMIEQIVRHLKDEDYEIIVVDDDSPDGTSQIVKSAMQHYPNLRLLTRNGNKGLVPSIKDGLEISTGDVCLWMDADLSMSPALIKQFVKKVNNGADLVLGSRYIRGGGMKGANINGDKTSLLKIVKNISISEDSVVSALISKFGNILLRIILSPSIHDYSSGYFCGKRETFRKVEIEGDFVDYCLSLPYKSIMKGLKVAEVPMILATRKYGESKTSNTISSILKIAFQCYKKAIILRLRTKNERR